MTMYKAYQLIGGNEAWVTCHATDDLSEIKPTFITVLSCDTLIGKDSPRPMVEASKYEGPLYFDLDDAHDVSAAIEGTQELWEKLKAYGLKESDVEIYLSGKKGLHVIIQPIVFMEKVQPVNKLPAIYKEIAFKLAVDTLDFNVYSARRGRMFRTHYNIRDNSNYKVQISVPELMSLTAEKYAEFCKTPRPLLVTNPSFCSAFGILYEGIRQRIVALKRIRTKPVDVATLRKHLPTIQKLMKGEGVKPNIGFNKIAIQLGIYAHEAKLSEDELINQCSGIIANHSGDGYRYNTPSKREHELRRMYCYLDEGAGYDYAIGPIQSMLETPSEDENEESPEGSPEENGGIFIKGGHYYVSTEMGERHIMDARFKDVVILRDPKTEEIGAIEAVLVVHGKSYTMKLERSTFATNGALHSAVSTKGASFTGSDVHARYIYTHMLRETKVNGRTVYATTSEGLDVICMPMSSIVEARTPFVVWVDTTGVRLPKNLEEQGLEVRFAPYDNPEGYMKTDLTNAPRWPIWSEKESNKKMMVDMLTGLLGSQEPGSLVKVVGWMTACFFTQLFYTSYKQFPLLHVAGPAGTGKTKLLEHMCNLFYVNSDPQVKNTVQTTNFAITSYLEGTASIPLILDEYKPAEMLQQKLNDLRSILRSNYSGQDVSRGGGNRMSTSFRALNTTKIKGPVAYVAEAMEVESAVLHRSVLVSLRRMIGPFAGRTLPSWNKFTNNSKCLNVIGYHIAASIIAKNDATILTKEFGPILAAAQKKYLRQEEDTVETVGAERLRVKANANDRVVFNYAVVEYGLKVFREVVEGFMPEEMVALKDRFDMLEKFVYEDMDKVVLNSLPEYLKVLVAASDLSRFSPESPFSLKHGYDFDFGKVGDTNTLNIIVRLAYFKYRQHRKAIGSQALYMNEDSFSQAIKDCPVFIKVGGGTKNIQQESLVLDYDAMIAQGVTPFHK